MNRLRLPFIAVLLSSLTVSASAAAQIESKKRLESITPYLSPEAIAVGRVDLSKIDVGATLKQFIEISQASGQQRAEMMTAEKHAKEMVDNLKKNGARDIYGVVNLPFSSSGPGYLLIPVDSTGNHRAVAGIMFSGDPQGPAGSEEANAQKYTGPRSVLEVCTRLGNVVYCGSKETLEQLKQNKPRPRPELVKAFASLGNSTAQLVVVPSDDNRRVMRELFPQLPVEFGKDANKALSDGLEWITVELNTPPNLSAKLTIQAGNPQSAADLKQLIQGIYSLLGQVPVMRQSFPMYDKLSELLTPKVEGDQLRLSLTKESQGVNQFLTLLSKPLEASRESARRKQCMNNLKQFGIAMHNFHDVHKSFPPSASYNNKGKKLLSWRVYILPFVGGYKLYKEFRLDEPWDSDHNKKLISRIPKAYQCPSAKLKKAGMTTYLAPLGKQTLFSGKTGSPIRDVIDGTSNTILIVDANPEHAVIWTKPDDLEIDMEKPLAGLVGNHETGFQALLCDGSVRFIPKSIDLKTLKALFTRNGKEPVGEF